MGDNMENFKFFALLALSLIGTMSLIKHITKWLYRNKTQKYILLVTVSNSTENPEMLIRNAVIQSSLSDDISISRVICVGKELNDNKKYICQKICGEYKISEYIDMNNFEICSFFDE